MIMTKIEIEYQKWGEYKGKYKGKISFEDGTSESFTFGLTPEQCAKYLTPIADEAINSAKELGAKIAESFVRNLEPSKEQKLL